MGELRQGVEERSCQLALCAVDRDRSGLAGRSVLDDPTSIRPPLAPSQLEWPKTVGLAPRVAEYLLDRRVVEMHQGEGGK